MRRAVLALLPVLALSNSVRADDDYTPAPITRHWRIHAEIHAHNEHHQKSATQGTVDNTAGWDASFDFTVGTTDDDIGGNNYAFSLDREKAFKDLTASGQVHKTEVFQAATKDAPKMTHFVDGGIDISSNSPSMSCLFSSATSWECTVKADYKAQEHWAPKGPAPNATVDGTFATFGQGGIHAKEAWSLATHDKQDHFTFKTDHNFATTPGDTNQILASVTIGPLETAKTYEAVFVTDKSYDTWLPEGPPIAPSTHQPDTIGLHVELRDAKTHRAISRSFGVHYVLDSSKLVGDCMNWPQRNAVPSEKPDLYFDTKKNIGDKISADEEALDLPDGQGAGAVIVSARDWGGYAHLVAHVTVSDGVRLDAIVASGKSAGTASLAIPMDDNGNHIADDWEKTAPHGHNADADDESEPSGWATTGDGYTLFEEYRGFVEADPSGTVVPAKRPKERHTRFEPDKRDVFVGLAVADNVIPLAQPGIATWAAMSKVTVHYVADSQLLKPTDGDYPGGQFPRRADLWGDGHDDLFGKPQMALWVQSTIVGDKPLAKRSPAHADPVRPLKPTPDLQKTEAQSDVYGSIGDVHGVALDLPASAATVSGIICYIDPACKIPDDQREGWETYQEAYAQLLPKAEMAKRAKWGHANEPELNRRFTQFTFIHELGHAAGMYHHGKLADKMNSAHGDKFCPMRYWHLGDNLQEQLDFAGGQWDLTTGPGGTPWKWCAENTAQAGLADKRR